MNLYRKVKDAMRVRLAPFADPAAWILLLISAVPLLFIDRPMLITLAQWTLYAFALAGVAVFLCRVLLPHVRLSKLMDEVHQENKAAAIVAAAVILFLGLLMLSMVLWARA